METNIPFSGFYDSIWDGEIDDLAERDAEYMCSGAGDWEGFEQAEIQSVLYDHTDHAAIHQAIARLYVDAWQDLINGELDLDIKLDFTVMVSPREYNFTTDRLFAEISRDDIAKIYKKVGRPRLRDKAEEMFTSRDGFSSFYSPNIEEWGPVREWDYNQLGCLMAAAGDMIEHDNGDNTWAVYYSIQEAISNEYHNSVDWPAVERDLQHMVDVENGEAEEDARKFPESGAKGAEYIREFEELNHLKGGTNE